MVRNVHSVRLRVPPGRAGALLDSLGSENNVLWPGDRWPPMRVDGPLRVGAAGRHGPVTYTVEDYVPSTRVCFRFKQPTGFVGTHTFEVFPEVDGCRLEHRVEITPKGLARLAWPLVFGPLHDALAEDAVSRAVHALGETQRPRRWSAWVRLLRGLGSVLARPPGAGEGAARPP
jgi:hypothetical protein